MESKQIIDLEQVDNIITSSNVTNYTFINADAPSKRGRKKKIENMTKEELEAMEKQKERVIQLLNCYEKKKSFSKK